jgi:hypothetical protein
MSSLADSSANNTRRTDLEDFSLQNCFYKLSVQTLITTNCLRLTGVDIGLGRTAQKTISFPYCCEGVIAR